MAAAACTASEPGVTLEAQQSDALVVWRADREAGITIRQAKELWNMPAIFLLILLLPASVWILRRKWGLV